MTHEVRRTYKFRLYTSKRDKHLHRAIDIAGLIWNHGVALQRRYYALTGRHIPPGELKRHIAKLRRDVPRYAHWQRLGSQAVQDVIERLDKAYQRFFKGQGGLPRFRKVQKFRSFTLKQAGWKLLGGNKIRLQGRTYKFVQHRPIGGTIKTVTVKRDSCGRLWLCFSVVETLTVQDTSTGQSGGFDYGLTMFLTGSNGQRYRSAAYLKAELARIRKLSRAIDRKVAGSRNQRKARNALHRTQIRIADKRRDAHYKLAHDLCDQFDVLIFEDLNIDGMKRLWGRKVSDQGFAQFLEILRWVAHKRGKTVVQIGRFEPTTQTCSHCGQRQPMPLDQRVYACSACGLVLDRDHNAALNIQAIGLEQLRSGASLLTDVGAVSPAAAGCSA